MTQDLHPKAITLALLIEAGRWRGHPEFEDSVYDSIAGYLHEYSDEHKSDLYARIVEGAPKSPGFLAIQKACDRALKQSEQIYGSVSKR